MTNEELLKSISDMLKKHQDYLSQNPDVFLGIQDRLFKAMGMDDSDDLRKAENDEKKTSKSGYRDWKPRDKYEAHHEDAIKKLMDDGWSHREAERIAGAYEGPKDFQSALSHKINPSQPSDKMLEIMKQHALDYKKRAAEREGATADPGVNPQKYASHQAQKAHEDVYGDYNKEYNAFLKDLDEQDLHPLEYDEAVSNWQKDWHEKNPNAREKMAETANAGKAFNEAKQARDEKIKEGALNIITGGASAGDQSSAGEYSEDASGGEANNFQTAAQMIGGSKGEHGYEAGTVKDPAAIFREQNPEFAEELKRKFAAKLAQNPEMKERHDAMPHREREMKQPSGPAPAPVKRLTPEEIQAQYGDRFKISKPKGGNE